MRRICGASVEVTTRPAGSESRVEASRPPEDVLGALRSHRLQDAATTDGHQEEQAPSRRADRDHLLMDGRQVVNGFTADQRVHLERQCQASTAAAAAAIVRSNVPGIPRRSSWRAAVDPSRLSEIASTPAARRLQMASAVNSGVALGATDTENPSRRASAIRSKRSARFSGSPPVRTRCGSGSPNSASRDSRWNASRRVSSPGSALGDRRGAAVTAGEVAGSRDFPVDAQRTFIVDVARMSVSARCAMGKPRTANQPSRSDRWVLFADTWIRGHISRLGGKELALAADCARPRQLTEVRKSRPVGTRLALFAASR